jgi:hypothetical protein
MIEETLDSVEESTQDNNVTEWQSETIDKLAVALSKAQGSLTGVKADAINPFFNSKYADLNSILTVVRPVLAENGLALVQGNKYDINSSGFYVTTKLIHSSGQWIYSEIRIPVGKKDAHGVGAACTYGRRFSLSAMLGISVDVDDDGNTAVGAPPSQQARR